MIRSITTILFILCTTLLTFADNYTLSEKWVDCGNGCQLLDPYYKDGVTFIWNGSSRKGKAHGYGIAKKFVNGEYESTYEGEYTDGIRSGRGVFTHKDGSVKKGRFINGQLMGVGTMETPNGSSYTGEFINYRMHGKGILRYGNGASFDGYWVSDEPYTGKFTNYNGEIRYIQNGIVVPKIKEQHTNYSPKIGSRITEYFDSEWNHCSAKNATYYRIVTYAAPHIPQGEVKDFYITGELQGVGTYVYIDYDDDAKSFKENEMTIYYRNGNVQAHYYYLNNKLNGPTVSYFENGGLSEESNYQYGILDGPTKIYYENGKLNIVALYEQGELKENKYLKFNEDDNQCYLVYNENFSKNCQAWEYEGINGRLSVKSEDKLTFDVSPERTLTNGLYVDFSDEQDNIIEVTTQLLDISNQNVVIGFLFGFKDWENYCGFYINRDQYLFRAVQNGKILTPETWNYTSSLTQNKNTISICNIGENVYFLINGESVGTIYRPHYNGGYYCITVGNQSAQYAHVEVQQLSVYELIKDDNDKFQPQIQSSAQGDWKTSGSGFFIDEQGYFVTNYHVVKDAKTIEISFPRYGQMETHLADIVMSDKQNDLSILKINSTDFIPLPPIPYNISTKIKDTGSEVFTLGFPIADIMGSEVKFTDGKISSKTGIQGDVTVYQISVPIQPGNSGGPLFDNQGNIVGITSSGLNRDYFKSENVNYAIKSSYLASLIDALPVTIQLQTYSDIVDLPLTEKIKLFQHYMVYVKVK